MRAGQPTTGYAYAPTGWRPYARAASAHHTEPPAAKGWPGHDPAAGRCSCMDGPPPAAPARPAPASAHARSSPQKRVGAPCYRTAAARVSMNALTARSRSDFECAADTWVLIRALPWGTTGKEKATTYTPFS